MQNATPVSTFRMNTCKSVAKQRTLTTFRINTGSVDIPDTVLISRVDKKRLTVFSDGAGGTMAEVGLLPFARVALEVAAGFASLPHALQQTSVHPAAVAG